jgi:succinoglycan biosynthesis protein ExoA
MRQPRSVPSTVLGANSDSHQNAGPLVSVIIPTRNEGAYIGRCLQAVFDNDYSRERVEIIIADGMSDDGTRGRVAEIIAAHPDRRIRLVDNPARTTPHGLNLAVKAASGKYIVRVDGHSQIYPDYIRRCIRLLETIPNAGCVGGLFENAYETTTAKVISLALSSPFGVGNALYRLQGRDGPVDTVPFGAFPREVFDRVGLFDEELLRNQDDEFNFRLRRAGYVVWLSPAIRVKYHTRGSFRRLARQFAQYGVWKVYVNRKHHAITTARQLIPPMWVAVVVAGMVGSLVNPALMPPLFGLLIVYAAAGLVAAVQKTRNPAQVLLLVWCFGLLHASYGVGYLRGVWRFLVLRKKPTVLHGTLTR